MKNKSYIERGVDLTLLVIMILVVWTINAEIFHLGGIKLSTQDEARLDLTLTPTDLGADQWQIGAMNLKEDQGVYQVNIVNENFQELFKLTLDAKTGRFTEKNRAGSSRTPLPIDEIHRRVVSLLPHLVIGDVFQKPGKPFAQVALLYEGHPVARIKVDPVSGRPFDPSVTVKEGRSREKRTKWIPGGLILPLGWTGSGLAILAVLYYSSRRSLIAQLKIAEEGKPHAIAVLKRTLDNHCWMSFIALAIILVHSFNAWKEVQWSLSWLALALGIMVSGSGLSGKHLMHHEAIRVTWRRFHIPIVVIFFFVTAIHAFEKLGFFPS